LFGRLAVALVTVAVMISVSSTAALLFAVRVAGGAVAGAALFATLEFGSYAAAVVFLGIESGFWGCFLARAEFQGSGLLVDVVTRAAFGPLFYGILSWGWTTPFFFVIVPPLSRFTIGFSGSKRSYCCRSRGGRRRRRPWSLFIIPVSAIAALERLTSTVGGCSTSSSGRSYCGEVAAVASVSITPVVIDVAVFTSLSLVIGVAVSVTWPLSFSVSFALTLTFPLSVAI
jgi:hypothetical protein